MKSKINMLCVLLLALMPSCATVPGDVTNSSVSLYPGDQPSEGLNTVDRDKGKSGKLELEAFIQPLPVKELPVISEEFSNQTFYQIDLIIRKLNSLITERQFMRWLDYLSEDYKSFYDEPKNLLRLSERKRLRLAGITLESIEDFFFYVVVPSRINIQLDDLIFHSENYVEAIMFVGDKTVSVYRLKLIDKYWKITL